MASNTATVEAAHQFDHVVAGSHRLKMKNQLERSSRSDAATKGSDSTKLTCDKSDQVQEECDALRHKKLAVCLENRDKAAWADYSLERYVRQDVVQEPWYAARSFQCQHAQSGSKVS